MTNTAKWGVPAEADDGKVPAYEFVTNTWVLRTSASQDDINTAIAIAEELGGATVSDQTLTDWVAGEAYQLTAITRNASEVPTTATVLWPDGSAGTFTATTINVAFSAVDAFTISHTLSGKTVTQAAVTRNAAGAVTAKPALTVG